MGIVSVRAVVLILLFGILVTSMTLTFANRNYVENFTDVSPQFKSATSTLTIAAPSPTPMPTVNPTTSSQASSTVIYNANGTKTYIVFASCALTMTTGISGSIFHTTMYQQCKTWSTVSFFASDRIDDLKEDYLDVIAAFLAAITLPLAFLAFVNPRINPNLGEPAVKATSSRTVL